MFDSSEQTADGGGSASSRKVPPHVSPPAPRPPVDAGRRHELIVELLESDGRVLVAEVADRTGVSEMTVRRDLRVLEGRGLLVRVHGGARPKLPTRAEPPFAKRTQRRPEAKRRIGRAAAGLTSDGESIVLDAGTTALEVARALKGRSNLRVLAMNLRIAALLVDEPGIELMVNGGSVRSGEHSLVGPLAQHAFDTLTFDTLLLTVGGIDPAVGVTDYVMEDVAIKRAALQSARRCIVIADATKLGTVAFARTCPVSDIDILVTDDSAPEEIVEQLRAAGVEVILA
jgi:DeoR/GlpR family transcriptional regulator of sugar metabolism